MNWIDAALFAGAFLGLVLGGVLVARSPSFWFAVGTIAFNKIAPVLYTYITKRMKPEDEAKLQRSVRSGQEWDNFRKRPKDK